MSFFVSEGSKRVIVILKPQTTALISYVIRSSPITTSEAPSQSPRIPRKLMQG